MLASTLTLALMLNKALAAPTQRSTSTYSINAGTPAPIADSAPVGISYEFFAFPGYVTSVGATAQCMANLDAAAGKATPIRIGGTTQDRATYDPDLTVAVNYTVASPADAPMTLTFGPTFFDLAGALSNPTILGLNRRLNNLNNSIAAAQTAKGAMPNLRAFELGNEPDLFTNNDPIAQGQAWTIDADIESQISWQQSVSSALNTDNHIQAGVYLRPPSWSIAKLAPVQQSTNTLNLVNTFCDHAYPQSACNGASTDLASLMDHSKIVSFIQGFAPEVAAANAVGKPIVFGETNSATCGGGGISPTFGAALWIVDYVLQAVKLGYSRLYFHQGTIGNSPYSWWGRYTTGAPYYGAVFAAQAVGGMTSVTQLDDGTGKVGVYVLSGDDGAKAVIYDSTYIASGTRSYDNVTLTDLCGSTASVKRLTAPYSTSRVDWGEPPTYAGQMFGNGDCNVQGQAVVETVTISNGAATFSVGQSEALLVELQNC